MNYIRERVELIKNDFCLKALMIGTPILACLHFYQYIDSGHLYEPLVRFIIASLFPFVIFFFGRKGSYWFWFIYANLLAMHTTFQNYTAFVMISIFIMLVPKMKIPALVMYTIEIIFIATYRNKDPVHIAIHFLNCTCFYYSIVFLLKPTVNKIKLNLTSDEIYILEELLQGKQQKEIDMFSQNTVTNKLKAAKNRNSVKTTDELLQRYKAEKEN